MAKKKILKDNGQEILPITHESCVLDNNGVSISSKIGNINELATDSRTDLVSAINDILEFKDNMKQEAEELKQKNENIRDTLSGLMQEGGYDITGEEDIDRLLELLTISGITLDEIKQIACGIGHTFILKNDASIWACGYNINGQLGLNDTTDRNTFTQVTTNISNDVKQIACGGNHTFILKNDGSIWCCGVNDYGQLGLGSKDTNAHSTFTQVTTNINNDIKQIACGYTHTFIIKNDGSVWACGLNNNGVLGTGDSGNYYTTFTKVTTNINNDVKQLACGQYYTFILKNDGSIWSCGLNTYGQLGLGNTTTYKTFTQVTTNINNDVKQVICGGNHTFILKNDASIWACGYNGSGQLGLNDTNNRNTFTQVNTNINNDVKQIACGDFYTFIIKNDGSVWSCGVNNVGQLGLNDTATKYTFTQITYNINNDAKQIACGQNHTFIIKNDGSVWSCGYNNYGQLGLGDATNNRYTFTMIPKGFSY